MEWIFLIILVSYHACISQNRRSQLIIVKLNTYSGSYRKSITIINCPASKWDFFLSFQIPCDFRQSYLSIHDIIWLSESKLIDYYMCLVGLFVFVKKILTSWLVQFNLKTVFVDKLYIKVVLVFILFQI